VNVATFQKLGLALLGVPYVLGAEVNPTTLDLPADLPRRLDCSELVQLLASKAGVPQIGDLAAAQWDKCSPVSSAAKLPMVGGIVVLRNNPARANRVGHIGLTIGRAKTYRYVLEARGHAYGTVLTRLKDITNPRLRAGAGPMGIYRPLQLQLTGEPVRLHTWRGIAPCAGVELVQTILRDLGYYRGSVDRKFGAATQAGVRAFEQAHGMLPTGAVTADVLAVLKAAHK